MAGRDIIIVDALRGATPGLDENDSRIRGALDLLGDLSEQTKCRGLVIHHARKPPDGGAEGGRYSIRGSSAIFDATDSAYIFSARKGEPVLVEHERAKSHGETVDNFALKFTDIELDGDPKGGVAVQVCGTEAIAAMRETEATGRDAKRTQSDAARIRRTLGNVREGVKASDLRARVRLSGERFTRALDALGDELVSYEERRGTARRATYYSLRIHPAAGGPQAEEGA
jgi:hypothetical protein